MLAGERDGPLGPEPGRVDHARSVRVIADQLAGHLERGPARLQAGASVGQQRVQPVPFRVGLLGQPAHINRHGLRTAHQRGESAAAERRIRIAARRCPLHVGDQPGMRGPRRLPGSLGRDVIRPRVKSRAESPDTAEERLRHRRAHLVQ